jgi:hypothetical protein
MISTSLQIPEKVGFGTGTVGWTPEKLEVQVEL